MAVSLSRGSAPTTKIPFSGHHRSLQILLLQEKQSQQCKRQWLLLLGAWRGFTCKFRMFANLSSDFFYTTLTSTRVSPVLRKRELARSSDCREMSTLVFVIWQKLFFTSIFLLLYQVKSRVMCLWSNNFWHTSHDLFLHQTEEKLCQLLSCWLANLSKGSQHYGMWPQCKQRSSGKETLSFILDKLIMLAPCLLKCCR